MALHILCRVKRKLSVRSYLRRVERGEKTSSISIKQDVQQAAANGPVNYPVPPMIIVTQSLLFEIPSMLLPQSTVNES